MDSKAHVRAAIAVALFLTTLLLFGRALRNDFVNYDDPDYVTDNAQVKAGLTAAGARWAMTAGVASNWHPLTWMSHMLDWSWHGDKPHGHHATSVGLHALNAAIAFAALGRLTGAVWTSAFAAALFAWHPLRVESVAWVAERKDVLSGLFWLLVLWAYAIFVERRRKAAPDAWRYYVLALIAFALGLMAKPMLVTLPFVLLLLDIWPLRRFGQDLGSDVRRLVLEKLPFFALTILSCVVTFNVQKAGGSVSSTLGLGPRLENAVVAVAGYLGKFLWPAELAVLYPHPGDWPVTRVLPALLLIGVISLVAIRQLRRRPWIGVGWFWFLGTLVPVIGLVQVGLQSMADRYTYLPILGVEIALLWTLRELAGTAVGRRSLLALAGSAALLALAVRTVPQIAVWKDSFTLFSHALAVTERNYVAHDNRGLHLFKHGQPDAAIADYRRALAINPAYLNANNNLGHALAQLGRPAEAIPLYRVALQANPAHLEVRNNLANALSDTGQLDEATQHYQFVLERAPNHVNALNGSAVLLAMRGQPAEAKARLERALQLAPGNASAHNNLGNVCHMLGLRDEAVRHYRDATALNPNDPHPHMLIGALLIEQRKFGEAVEALQRAVAIRPSPEAHARLGVALANSGRRDEARRALQTALQQKPDYAEARQWLQAVEQMK